VLEDVPTGANSVQAGDQAHGVLPVGGAVDANGLGSGPARDDLGLQKSNRGNHAAIGRILCTLVAAALALSSAAAATASGPPSARVENVAVVVLHIGTTATTNFDFDVSDCPAGELVNIAWEAEQPEPGTSTGGEGTFAFSTGGVQHFVVSTVGGFRPGYAWTGSGVVTCGAVVIPIAGTGITKTVNGV
jgi:hypothetical protein